ncbi:MAG: glycosyltransferase [Chitinophagales bacterium]|nr:glycosyltransferase [Bacteroidota bacterium]
MENNSPLVSIIIATYNRANLLQETLENVLQQTYTNWECWIIDDGSTDNTLAVMEDFCSQDARFRSLKSDGNKGPAHARNIGLQMAQGMFIQFLDSDDFLENGKIAAHVNFLLEHSEVDIVYGSCRYFTNEDYSLRQIGRLAKTTNERAIVNGTGLMIMQAILQMPLFQFNAAIFRRKLFAHENYFNEDFIYGEDVELSLRLAQQGAVFQYHNPPNTFALIRSHAQSLLSDKTRSIAATQKLYRKFWQSFPAFSLRKIIGKKLILLRLKQVFFALLTFANQPTTVSFYPLQRIIVVGKRLLKMFLDKIYKKVQV